MVVTRTLPLTLAAALLTGCGDPRPLPPADEYLFQHESIPVGFLLPPGWRHHTVPVGDGSALVFAGPASERSAFTPITVQMVPMDGTSLDELVDRIVADAALHPRFALWTTGALVAAGRGGLSYALELDLNESRQWQQAAILPAGDFWLHLSVAAVPDYFPEAIPVFERLLTTLVIGSGAPGSPPDLW